MKYSFRLVLLYISLLLISCPQNSNGSKDGGHGDHDLKPGNGHDHDHQKPGKGPGKINCPQLEAISRDITWRNVVANPALPAKLIRMQFHDCVVRGCDASILLDSTGNTKAEKEAIPNRSLAGFDVIDDIKARVEEECSGQVSCADIIALAARDAVSFPFRRPLWPVSIGRKDGKVSLESEANRDLPSPAANFSTLLQQFQSLGLDVVDLVALSGAHTIGVGHCVIIRDRLYNFTGKGDTDPTLDQNYANFLKKKCPNNPDSTTTVEMDPGSSLSFDTDYFLAINQNKGLFQSDAALITDPKAAQISTSFQDNPDVFFAQFAQSMVKMGSIGVFPGQQGEIRKNCHFINP